MTKIIFFDIETTGLNPITDRILCIGILNNEHENIITFYGEDEVKILEQFWNSIKCENLNNLQLIGWCSNSFDFQFILVRSLLNNIQINKIFPTLADLRNILYSCNIYMKGKLRDFASCLLINIKTENGIMMKSYYETKDWTKIKDHCEEDIMLVKGLYNKLINLNFI